MAYPQEGMGIMVMPPLRQASTNYNAPHEMLIVRGYNSR